MATDNNATNELKEQLIVHLMGIRNLPRPKAEEVINAAEQAGINQVEIGIHSSIFGYFKSYAESVGMRLNPDIVVAEEGTMKGGGNSGLPTPEDQARKMKRLIDSIVNLGRIVMEEGFTDFSSWEAEMLKSVSGKLKPFLAKVYAKLQAERRATQNATGTSTEASLFGTDKSPSTIQLKSKSNQNIHEETNEITGGQSVFERFSPGEQHGLAEGGRIHVATSIILGGESGTDTTSRFPPEEQEAVIETLAKENGIWLDNSTTTLNKTFGPNFANGAESVIWDDGSYVVKAQTTIRYGNLQEKLDGITLHNTLFPEAKLTVLGFGRDHEGEFVVLVRQAFIKGTKPTAKDIEDYLRKLGFEPYGEGGFINEQTVLDDVNLTNVIMVNGRPVVFDPQPRLNTPEMGYGGKRDVSCKEITVETKPKEEPQKEAMTTSIETGTEILLEKTNASNSASKPDNPIENLKKQPFMKKKLTYVGIVLAGILVILMLLNPSMERFKEFVPSEIGTSEIYENYLSMSRVSNWLIFSVYEFKYYESNPRKYYGFLNNFFKIE